jgi:hypothetical protein
VCFLFAAGVMPIGIIFCLLYRSDLKGRRLRARQLKPNDVRRLWAGELPVSLVIRRFRV